MDCTDCYSVVSLALNAGTGFTACLSSCHQIGLSMHLLAAVVEAFDPPYVLPFGQAYHLSSEKVDSLIRLQAAMAIK